MRINTENENVFEVEMSKAQVRFYAGGGELPDDVLAAFDEAQGYLDGDIDTSYLVIVIKS
jgi:hypothetical protein